MVRFPCATPFGHPETPSEQLRKRLIFSSTCNSSENNPKHITKTPNMNTTLSKLKGEPNDQTETYNFFFSFDRIIHSYCALDGWVCVREDVSCCIVVLSALVVGDHDAPCCCSLLYGFVSSSARPRSFSSCTSMSFSNVFRLDVVASRLFFLSLPFFSLSAAFSSWPLALPLRSLCCSSSLPCLNARRLGRRADPLFVRLLGRSNCHFLWSSSSILHLAIILDLLLRPSLGKHGLQLHYASASCSLNICCHLRFRSARS